MAEDIKIEEWLKELERVSSPKSDDGYTTTEIREKLHLGREKARAYIRDGIKRGVIVVGKRFVPQDWDGRDRFYTVYKLKGSERMVE